MPDLTNSLRDSLHPSRHEGMDESQRTFDCNIMAFGPGSTGWCVGVSEATRAAGSGVRKPTEPDKRLITYVDVHLAPLRGFSVIFHMYGLEGTPDHLRTAHDYAPYLHGLVLFPGPADRDPWRDAKAIIPLLSETCPVFVHTEDPALLGVGRATFSLGARHTGPLQTLKPIARILLSPLRFR